jgi:hypothetical protein
MCHADLVMFHSGTARQDIGRKLTTLVNTFKSVFNLATSGANFLLPRSGRRRLPSPVKEGSPKMIPFLILAKQRLEWFREQTIQRSPESSLMKVQLYPVDFSALLPEVWANGCCFPPRVGCFTAFARCV